MKSLLVVVAMFAGCALLGVRQQDLDAWVGVPVVALDTHSIFLTIPMFRTVTPDGVEIRNYSNGADVSRCFGANMSNATPGLVNAAVFSSCSSSRIACNNLFYIRDGKVLEYVPSGRCYTDQRAQPEPRYLKLSKPVG